MYGRMHKHYRGWCICMEEYTSIAEKNALALQRLEDMYGRMH